jgi:hypothetical protein
VGERRRRVKGEGEIGFDFELVRTLSVSVQLKERGLKQGRERGEATGTSGRGDNFQQAKIPAFFSSKPSPSSPLTPSQSYVSPCIEKRACL